MMFGRDQNLEQVYHCSILADPFLIPREYLRIHAGIKSGVETCLFNLLYQRSVEQDRCASIYIPLPKSQQREMISKWTLSNAGAMTTFSHSCQLGGDYYNKDNK